MLTLIDCIPCLMKQSVNVLRMCKVNEDDIHNSFKKVIRSLSEYNSEKTPPEILSEIYNIIKTETGEEDPYKFIKNESIVTAFSYYNLAKEKIKGSLFPFETALRYSLLGNIIDFGVPEFNRSDMQNNLSADIYLKNLNKDKINELYEEIALAETITYLGDNAGETVFDRLFIDSFPGNVKVFYSVRGGPVINDATLEDAYKSKINEVAEIISNGAAIPGTVIKYCSEEFIEVFDKSSVIIAKGQGNFETLNNNDKKIFFLFQVKCSVIADAYNFGKGDWVITDSLTLKERWDNENCCCFG